jgi:hypothetical protein
MKKDNRLIDAMTHLWKARELFIELANDQTADKTDRGASQLICEQSGWDWKSPQKRKRHPKKN